MLLRQKKLCEKFDGSKALLEFAILVKSCAVGYFEVSEKSRFCVVQRHAAKQWRSWWPFDLFQEIAKCQSVKPNSAAYSFRAIFDNFRWFWHASEV